MVWTLLWERAKLLAVVLVVWAFQIPTYLLHGKLKAYRLRLSMALKISDFPNVRNPSGSAHRHQLWILPKWKQKTKVEVSKHMILIPHWHIIGKGGL